MAITLERLLQEHGEELRIQPTAKRIRAEVDGVTAFDTTEALLVWEPGRVVPGYAVPVASIAGSVHERTAHEVKAPEPGTMLDPRYPFDVRTTAGRPVTVSATGTAAGVDGFVPDDPDLADYVLLDFAGFQRWWEEDEEIVSHPHDPFSRIDVRASHRHVQVLLDGDLLADTRDALLLFETHLPVRYYLPRTDVRVPLSASDTHSFCAYKGKASYWTALTPGGNRHDIAWSYEHPLTDALPVAGYVAFWDERTDLVLDGVPQPRPWSPFAD